MEMDGRDPLKARSSDPLKMGALLDYECDAAQAHQCARSLAQHKLAESNLCVIMNPKQDASGTVLGPAPVESGGSDAVPSTAWPQVALAHLLSG